MGWFYVFTFIVYIISRWYVQSLLIRTTRGMVFKLRMEMFDRIFAASYENFERIDRGRVYTTVNDNIGTVGNAVNMIVNIIPNLITTVVAMIYLAAISFHATLILFGTILLISTVYYFTNKKARRYFEEARESQAVFMRLLNGMIDGFKELSLSNNKKNGYKKDIGYWASVIKDKTTTASYKFLRAFMIGELLLILILGVVAILIPELFQGIRQYTLVSFVMVVLYLIGPINAVISNWASVLEFKVALKRVRDFIASIPAANDPEKVADVVPPREIETFHVQDLSFKYQAADSEHPFQIGPVNLQVNKGEILFIVGGNGSGKTTLAKLLTGLYTPEQGRILIDGNPVSGTELSAHFSAVFSPMHLFQKIYDIAPGTHPESIQKWLEVMKLNGKVQVWPEEYSHLNLSQGQLKRLALLQCFLEDKPVYLFDEWAADQDPEYRHCFYEELLPYMKGTGKTVIAITHDDRYFFIADKIVKMEMGQTELVPLNYKVENLFNATHKNIHSTFNSSIE
ncbi:cyclic peptide export ABC transporter [Longitalea arenae]|uniref:cyclic peptide export ABC transporter n=1 Tax=Longitalea arenae TaxID=2812558 RepID=UPI0034E253DF